MASIEGQPREPAPDDKDERLRKQVVRRGTRQALEGDLSGFEIVDGDDEFLEALGHLQPGIDAAIRGYDLAQDSHLTPEAIAKLSAFAAQFAIQKEKSCEGLPATLSLAEFASGSNPKYLAFQKGPGLPKDKLIQVVTDLRNVGESVIGVYGEEEIGWIYFDIDRHGSGDLFTR